MKTQKLEIAISQLEKVHKDMKDCTNRYILRDAIDQLQEIVKLFAIPDVIKSVCDHYWIRGRISDKIEICTRCNKTRTKPSVL